MEVNKNRNSVYNIKYHLMWCVRHKSKVLTGAIATDLERVIMEISAGNNFKVEQLEISPNCVRLDVLGTPNHLITDIIKALKGVSARSLFKQHPHLKQLLNGDHLWNPTYLVLTVGQISEEVIRNFMERQGG